MFKLREHERERVERRRGWIVYFLFKARPHPLELASLIRLLDRRNFPLSRRGLAEEIDYLRSLRLIRVFNSDAQVEIDEVGQARLVQRYADCESDEEMGEVLCARITAAGINFQEGRNEADGVQRVE